MKVELVNKPAFAVLGKLGQGPSDCGPRWIAPLWEEANSHFDEIGGLAKSDGSGKAVHVWGIMSDTSGRFLRWGAEGKYLAGCEVREDAEAPPDWTLWKVPGQTYVAIACTQETYGDAFNYVLNEFLPQKGYELIGAVHEYYPPDAVPGSLMLYFPVERD